MCVFFLRPTVGVRVYVESERERERQKDREASDPTTPIGITRYCVPLPPIRPLPPPLLAFGGARGGGGRESRGRGGSTETRVDCSGGRGWSYRIATEPKYMTVTPLRRCLVVYKSCLLVFRRPSVRQRSIYRKGGSGKRDKGQTAAAPANLWGPTTKQSV